ncbi:MAG: undecaprenyldiphospho-muramoylpentapeptide beta-N-acetylglucosaminyltransferase, partial [Bacilli bacterium]
MKIVLSGGGTGGHIYPALAFYRYVKQMNQDIEFLYIGTSNGLEKKIVEKEGIPFFAIEISGLQRKVSLQNIKTGVQFIKSVYAAKRKIKEFNPDVVIGTGGYVCGPVVYAANAVNIPTIIHEQNSLPGLTNKFLSRFASRVATCFLDANQYFPANKVVLTGNPRATEVSQLPDVLKKPIEALRLNPLIPTVVITSGSRGARPINEAVIAFLQTNPQPKYNVVFITGEVHYEKVMRQLSTFRLGKTVAVLPYVSEMPQLLKASDLVVSRAGATILAELTALHKPSILIPSPYVTANHQEINARSLVNENAAYMITEHELTSEVLQQHITSLLYNEENYKAMQQGAAKVA